MNRVKIVISLLALCVFTLGIPKISAYTIFIIPFIFRFFNFLSLPKYVLKYWPISFSSFLLLLFSVINFYLSIYVYKLDYSDRLDFRFFTIVLTINILYWMGISLNFRKIPFPSLSILVTNLFIFLGGILLSYMSVAKYIGSSLPSLIVNIEDRKIPSFWSSESTDLIGGNFFDMNSYLGLSVSGTLIFVVISLVDYYRPSRRMKIKSGLRNLIFTLCFTFLLLTILFMSFYTSVALIGRGPLVVLILSTFTTLVIINLYSIKSRSKVNLLIVFCGFLFLFLIVFQDSIAENFGSAISSLTDAGVGNRFVDKGTDSPRYELWQLAISQIWDFPFGGRQMSLLPCCPYVHNIWLDQLYDAGIIPMVLLLMFHLSQIPVIIKLMKLNLLLLVKIFVSCTLIAFLTAFMILPVIQSSYIYFSMSCFFFGSLARFVIDMERFGLSESSSNI